MKLNGNISAHKKCGICLLIALATVFISLTANAQDVGSSELPDSIPPADSTITQPNSGDSTITEPEQEEPVEEMPTDSIEPEPSTGGEQEEPVEETPTDSIEPDPPTGGEQEEPAVSITDIGEPPAEETKSEEKPPAPVPLFKPTLGIGGGLFTYYGDLKPYKYSSRLVDNLGYDFTISTRINRYLTLGLYFIKG